MPTLWALISLGRVAHRGPQGRRKSETGATLGAARVSSAACHGRGGPGVAEGARDRRPTPMGDETRSRDSGGGGAHVWPSPQRRGAASFLKFEGVFAFAQKALAMASSPMPSNLLLYEKDNNLLLKVLRVRFGPPHS